MINVTLSAAYIRVKGPNLSETAGLYLSDSRRSIAPRPLV